MDPFEFLAETNLVKNDIIASFTRTGYHVKPDTIVDDMLSFRLYSRGKRIGSFASPFKQESRKRHFLLFGFRDRQKMRELASIIEISSKFQESGMKLSLKN